MSEQDHTLQLTHNEYGWWGDCECSNPDFEGTGLVGWWSMDKTEVETYHGEHITDVDEEQS